MEKKTINQLIEFFAAVPGLTPWEAGAFYALSFFTSGMTAAAGIGGGVVLLAVMTTAYPPAVLIPLHSVIQLGSNGGRALVMIRDVLIEYLPVFVLGSIAGGLIGAQIFAELPGALLKTVLGLFILYAAWGPAIRALAPSRRTFFGLGAVASFGGIFVGGTGPMIAPFIAAATERRQSVVATHAAFMTFQHVIRIGAFGILGFAFAPYAGFVIGMIATGFAGTLAGRHFLNRLPERAFRIVFKTILTVLALRLLWTALV